MYGTTGPAWHNDGRQPVRLPSRQETLDRVYHSTDYLAEWCEWIGVSMCHDMRMVAGFLNAGWHLAEPIPCEYTDQTGKNGKDTHAQQDTAT